MFLLFTGFQVGCAAVFLNSVPLWNYGFVAHGVGESLLATETDLGLQSVILAQGWRI